MQENSFFSKLRPVKSIETRWFLVQFSFRIPMEFQNVENKWGLQTFCGFLAPKLLFFIEFIQERWKLDSLFPEFTERTAQNLSSLKIWNEKAAPRFELGIEDLQSTALPLGHTAYYFTD